MLAEKMMLRLWGINYNVPTMNCLLFSVTLLKKIRTHCVWTFRLKEFWNFCISVIKCNVHYLKRFFLITFNSIHLLWQSYSLKFPIISNGNFFFRLKFFQTVSTFLKNQSNWCPFMYFFMKNMFLIKNKNKKTTENVTERVKIHQMVKEDQFQFKIVSLEIRILFSLHNYET